MMSSLMISDSHPSDFFDIGPEGIATETMRHERGMRRWLHDAQAMGLGCVESICSFFPLWRVAIIFLQHLHRIFIVITISGWLATSKSQCRTAKQNDFNHIYSKWSSCWSSFKFFTVFSVSKIFCVNQQRALPHCFSEIFICIPCSILQVEGLVPDIRMDYRNQSWNQKLVLGSLLSSLTSS